MSSCCGRGLQFIAIPLVLQQCTASWLLVNKGVFFFSLLSKRVFSSITESGLFSEFASTQNCSSFLLPLTCAELLKRTESSDHPENTSFPPRSRLPFFPLLPIAHLPDPSFRSMASANWSVTLHQQAPLLSVTQAQVAAVWFGSKWVTLTSMSLFRPCYATLLHFSLFHSLPSRDELLLHCLKVRYHVEYIQEEDLGSEEYTQYMPVK